MIPRTISVEEAARHFNVMPCTVRAWIRSGRLAAFKIGKQYFIPELEVNKMLLADKPKADTDLVGKTRQELVSEFVNGVRISIPITQIWENRRQKNSRRRDHLQRCAKCQ